MSRVTIKMIPAFFMLALLTACGGTTTEKGGSSDTASVNEIYEVHHDSRIHVFYTRAMYESFLKVGETPFRLTRIAKGPNRETMVFGLHKKDKKLKKRTKEKTGVAAIDLYDAKASAADDFYGEIRKHGRIYVFSNFNDMGPVRQFGHPNFFYMQVASGPNKETVMYVLNKKTKKKKPVGLIAKFKKMNNI